MCMTYVIYEVDDLLSTVISMFTVDVFLISNSYVAFLTNNNKDHQYDEVNLPPIYFQKVQMAYQLLLERISFL